MTEGDVVGSIRKYLKDKGYFTYNLQVVTPSGMPDMVVIDTDGRHIYLEVKKQGGRIGSMQKYIIKKLKKRQCEVHVVWSLNDVKEIL